VLEGRQVKTALALVSLLILLGSALFTFGSAAFGFDEALSVWINESDEASFKGTFVPEHSTQNCVEWNKTYGGAQLDMAYWVHETMDGGYAIAGWTDSFGVQTDFWLVKTDAAGNMEWNKTYGRQYYDMAYSAQQTSDEGYIMAGRTASFIPEVGALRDDFWLVKTDANGNMEWNKTYGGRDWDLAFSVQQTGEGGYVVTGWTSSFGAGGNDFWLVKTDANGNMEWNKTYGSKGFEEPYSVQQTGDGGYIIAGIISAHREDFWLVKTDSEGNMQWNKTYGGSEIDGAGSVLQTSDGGYIVAGFTYSFGSGGADFWLVKTDANGNMEWNKTYGGSLNDFACCIRPTSDGGYIVAGDTESFGAGGYDFWLLKIDSAGNMEGSKVLGGVGDDSARSVQQTSDGGYVVAGYTYSYGAGKSDFWIVKLPKPQRNIAVAGVTPAKTVIGQGYSLFVDVLVENQGDFFAETFNLTAYANATLIQTETVTLLAGSPKTVTFKWNTTDYTKGNYIISAIATQVSEETNITDNVCVNGSIHLVLPGDSDLDGDIDIYDIVMITSIYGLKSGNPNFNPNVDWLEDGMINIYDVVIATSHYGEKDP
jgi:hypothetical protein